MKKMRKAYQLTDEILSPILVQYHICKMLYGQSTSKVETNLQNIENKFGLSKLKCYICIKSARV
jgi:hypothetical protein